MIRALELSAKRGRRTASPPQTMEVTAERHLSRNCSRNRLIGTEVKIECMRLSLQPREPLVAESGFIMFHAFVHRWLAICEHPGDQTRACVGHGGDGCGRAESSPEASRVGAQGASAVPQALRAETQGIGSAVDHVAGAAGAHVAPADPVVGTQTEPGGEGCFGLPPAHVQADLRDAGVRGEPCDARDAGEVHAADAGEV